MDVLLVEDEASVRELLREDLQDAGLAVTPVTDGEAGLRALAARLPAVVVTDVNLGPGMNGVDLASEVRRRWPHVAVILMTGDESNLERLSLDRFDGCFVKPFNPPRLVAAVSAILTRSVH